ncbi:amidohydrolase family protein [Paenibacillus sp. FJAT-26967]|uniref:amidohydrolase family protein n=1 Tax=Paenibacillus sp. FJAT-26967 TaxID=1729690 RepID=UPI000839655D|nr:amidohydrolase family protein [Paenibacillus sp. FJAT-26967]
MIIDGHAHISREAHSSPELLLADMEAAGVSRAVLVPGGMLDVRRMTRFITGQERPITTIPPNDVVLEIMREHPDRFYGFCCINPGDGSEAALAALDEAHNNGFKGLKMSPLVHQFAFTGKVSQELAALCADFNIPYYTHVLFNPNVSTAALGELAKSFPKTNFVIGHMGVGPLDIDTIELAASRDNIYLETSTANPLAIMTAIQQAGPDKIFYGSEFPLSDPYVEKVKIERLRISDEDKETVLYRTISRLLGL